jgi:hypothetical protein
MGVSYGTCDDCNCSHDSVETYLHLFLEVSSVEDGPIRNWLNSSAKISIADCLAFFW